MFSIGIEFSLKSLAEVKWVALGGGMLGIVLLIGLATGSRVGGGMATHPEHRHRRCHVSVASTMVLARNINRLRAVRFIHGKVMLTGITLVEDVAVIAMTVLIP